MDLSPEELFILPLPQYCLMNKYVFSFFQVQHLINTSRYFVVVVTYINECFIQLCTKTVNQLHELFCMTGVEALAGSSRRSNGGSFTKALINNINRCSPVEIAESGWFCT